MMMMQDLAGKVIQPTGEAMKVLRTDLLRTLGAVLGSVAQSPLQELEIRFRAILFGGPDSRNPSYVSRNVPPLYPNSELSFVPL